MPGTDPAGSPGPQVVALGRTVERTARRVGELDTLLAQLANDVTALARTRTPPPGDAAAGEDDEAAVWSWLLVEDADQALTDLVDLVRWLERVYLRYPGTALPSCWLWHPAVIEELRWLRGAHTDAYDPQAGSWMRVGDWHDRQLPGVVRRVRDSAGSCELALHTAGGERARPPVGVPLAGHLDLIADAWATARPHEPGPEPTQMQLAEAARHDRDQHRASA